MRLPIQTRAAVAFCNEPRTTRSAKSAAKKQKPEGALTYDKVFVPGGAVDWREDKKIVRKYRRPVVVRISRTKNKGEYYKSVHAAKNTPRNAMVGIYLGEVVDYDLVSDGRWCAAVPGYFKSKSLNSKITEDWPWEKYIAKKAVGGFFNSSRKTTKSKSNLKDANCELRWFYKSYDGGNINGGRVYAALFTRRSVRRGDELLWDYKWLP